MPTNSPPRSRTAVHWPADINEVYWGTIAFLVIVGLAVWKAGPAIQQAMKDRTAGIEAELAEAKAARAEAEAAAGLVR